MRQGKLEVLLCSAKGLEDTDFLSNMDPYVILTCRTQEQKSSVASGNGSEPEWNETFVFTISGSVSKLIVKIMDKDTFSSDDFVGEAKLNFRWMRNWITQPMKKTIPCPIGGSILCSISLEPVFSEGEVPPTAYNVVKDGEYCGEVRVGLTFTPERAPGFPDEEESYGGWKESSMD